MVGSPCGGEAWVRKNPGWMWTGVSWVGCCVPEGQEAAQFQSLHVPNEAHAVSGDMGIEYGGRIHPFSPLFCCSELVLFVVPLRRHLFLRKQG